LPFMLTGQISDSQADMKREKDAWETRRQLSRLEDEVRNIFTNVFLNLKSPRFLLLRFEQLELFKFCDADCFKTCFVQMGFDKQI